MAALGDDRPGVGLDPNGLPDIVWVDIAPGDFLWQEGERRVIDQPYRIARYPVTHAQYLVFTQAPDYASGAWWEEISAPSPAVPQWDPPNRSRVEVA
jgi:formylglycine-generating enzyme required for sulfatase activity